MLEKNGKKIFEGDIVKCWAAIYVVTYKDGSPVLIDIATSRYADLDSDDEVIGNIFENEDLLPQDS